MRHLMRGRKLGRNSSHRKAMFRNMAASLIKTVRIDEDTEGAPKVSGRIVTTVAKAKELRPFVERLVTIAKKAAPHEERAAQFATTAEKGSDAWKKWRGSSEWEQWAQAMAPAVTYRRRAFSLLRDKEAVDILFSELAERFADRDGGYTRIVQLAKVRLGDAGKQALIEFVGERDRVKQRSVAPVVVEDDEENVEGDTQAAGDSAPEGDESETTAEVEAASTEATEEGEEKTS
ncbi:50S ribosomal protein L17 [Thalassoglobus neptunius]|uniref:Large ribosomal subunit protein bL17 n=1 Tax=Thalassoglobus neptunius TaxID=1938619 RepID=A0A5C5X6A7_9PLAN|nr:L17 family ribosomal protein [Thalassoglobus neptunius]TWT58566.1 50S ribosomal protein L17 [Thalassoglobus neptunius]